MNLKQLQYFLNVIFYCMWIQSIKGWGILYKILDVIFFPILHFMPDSVKKRREQNKLASETFYNNEHDGFHIDIAMRFFKLICAGYMFIVGVIFMITSFKIISPLEGRVDMYLRVGIFMLPTMAVVIIINKMAYQKKNYLRFFNEFKKKDNAWLKKWLMITFFFEIGALIAFLFGFIGARLLE